MSKERQSITTNQFTTNSMSHSNTKHHKNYFRINTKGIITIESYLMLLHVSVFLLVDHVTFWLAFIVHNLRVTRMSRGRESLMKSNEVWKISKNFCLLNCYINSLLVQWTHACVPKGTCYFKSIKVQNYVSHFWWLVLFTDVSLLDRMLYLYLFK